MYELLKLQRKLVSYNHSQHTYHTAGNLSREKTFTNFTVLWLFAKFFFAKFWGVASFGTAKVFSAKILFFTNSQKFSPLTVSRYTIKQSLAEILNLSVLITHECISCNLKDSELSTS